MQNRGNTPLIPVLTKNDWRLLYKPARFGCYVNDHTIIRSHIDGSWHLFGITRQEAEICPAKERYFTHAVGKTLNEPCGFKELGIVCDNGTPAWSPYIVFDGDRYYMFYGPSPIKMATSDELIEWRENRIELRNCPLDAAHRDPTLLRVNNKWLMYVVGARKGKGLISVFESNDLIAWDFIRIALALEGENIINVPWGALESPSVINIGSYYYMFITYTDSEISTYHNTFVFRTKNPYNFGEFYPEKGGESGAIASLYTHAPEVIFDPDSARWFITTCGWRNRGTPIEGGVAFRELEWQTQNNS